MPRADANRRFALLANAISPNNDAELTGDVVALRNTVRLADRELERRQRVHCKANPNSHLDIRLVELEWLSHDSKRARGTLLSDVRK